MRTSSPRLWIWMRMPSSFHSTDASSNPSRASSTLSAVDASIGSTGLKSSKPTPPSAASPPSSASSGVRDRIDEDSCERALPQLTREQAPDEVRLVGGRAREQVDEQLASLRRRALAGRRLDLRDGAVDVENGQRRLGRRRCLDAEDRRVADADAALPRHAG